MSGFLTGLWDRILTAIEGSATKVEATFTATEQAVLQQSHPFFQQVETTLGVDGIDTVKQLLATALASLAAGGSDLGPVITNVAEQALTKLVTDVTAEAKNAVYGLIAILLPGIQNANVAA